MERIGTTSDERERFYLRVRHGDLILDASSPRPPNR